MLALGEVRLDFLFFSIPFYTHAFMMDMKDWTALEGSDSITGYTGVG